MHGLRDSQHHYWLKSTFKAFIISTVIIIFMFCSSPKAAATTEVQILDVAPVYVTCTSQGVAVFSLKLYNETDNNVSSMTVTLNNITSFDPNDQLEPLSSTSSSGLALYNETNGIPGFQSDDTFLPFSANDWVGGPATWISILYNASAHLPSTEPPSPNLHIVIRMTQLCQDDAAFNISIQANSIITKFGAVPATAIWSKDITVDASPPRTELSITGPQAGSSPMRASKLTQFNLTANDSVSRVSSTEYRVDSGAWIPNDGDFLISIPGHHNISYRSTDNAGHTEIERTLWIYVNSPPIIAGAPVASMRASEQYSYDVEATDPDPSDVLTYSLLNASEGMVIDTSTGVITWTPGSDQVGQHRVAVLVSDGLESDIRVFNITVSAPDSTVGISPVTVGVASVAVVVGVLGVLAAGTEFGKFKLIAFFIPLYTRLKKEKVLEHFTRGRIYGYIQANPGEHLNAIKRALEINNGAIVYHLNTLERMGYIKSKIDRSYKRFYPTKVKLPEKSMGELIQIQKDIVKVIRDSPGSAQKDIAVKLEVSKQLVNYHMKILVDAGFVVTKSEGNSISYNVADDLNV